MLFIESLKRWGFAASVEQAREWWMLLKTRGDVAQDAEEMVKAVCYIGNRCKKNGVSVTFPSQATTMIDEYRLWRQNHPKKEIQ